MHLTTSKIPPPDRFRRRRISGCPICSSQLGFALGSLSSKRTLAADANVGLLSRGRGQWKGEKPHYGHDDLLGSRKDITKQMQVNMPTEVFWYREVPGWHPIAFTNHRFICTRACHIHQYSISWSHLSSLQDFTCAYINGGTPEASPSQKETNQIWGAFHQWLTYPWSIVFFCFTICPCLETKCSAPKSLMLIVQGWHEQNERIKNWRWPPLKCTPYWTRECLVGVWPEENCFRTQAIKD